MRYWFDTEFIEDGKTIDLLSIGIISEDGREYYAINYDCDFSKASEWVQENVIKILPQKPEPCNYRTAKEWKDSDAYIKGWRNKESIRDEVAEFFDCETIPITANNRIRGLIPNCNGPNSLLQLKPSTQKPEIWGYYAAYDWVAFCQLFGTMMDLPTGFPMYCRDIKQECDRLGNPDLPAYDSVEHHALADARWNRKAWEFLQCIESKSKT